MAADGSAALAAPDTSQKQTVSPSGSEFSRTYTLDTYWA